MASLSNLSYSSVIQRCLLFFPCWSSASRLYYIVRLFAWYWFGKIIFSTSKMVSNFLLSARRVLSANSCVEFNKRNVILHKSFSSHSSKAKEALISRLLEAKDNCGKSFDEIAAHLGLTNVYAAQLFMNQAQLKPHLVLKLKEIVPLISSTDLLLMQKFPFRSFDPQVGLIKRLLVNFDPHS